MFNRFVCILLAAVVSVCLFSVISPKVSAVYTAGDADANGTVNIEDARIALRVAIGLESFDGSDSYFAADVVGTDGKIDINDARKILRVAVGLDKFDNVELSTKEDILNFYKTAVNRVAAGGIAGYHYRISNEVKEIDTTNFLFDYLLKEQLNEKCAPQEYTYARGSDDAKNNFPACSLIDYNNIAYASVSMKDDNYVITIILNDEENPTDDNNCGGQIMNSIMSFEEFKESLGNTGFAEMLTTENTHIFYDDPTITCTVTADGRIISMNHITDILLTLDTEPNIICHNVETREYTDFMY